MNVWMNDWVNESMNQWIDESMHAWMNEWMNMCTDGITVVYMMYLCL